MIVNYQKTRWRLTGLYFGILLVVVMLFSLLIINVENQQFTRFEQFKKMAYYNASFLYDNQLNDYIDRVDATIREAKINTLINIAVLDAFLLTISMIVSYYLAGETMKPLLHNLEHQKRFVSDASHELRTPLAAIRTEAEVIARSKKATIEEFRGFAGSVIEETDRLTNLANNLLELVKLEDHHTENTEEQIDLVDLIDDVTQRLKKYGESKDVEIRFEKPEGEYRYRTNKMKMDRLLSIIIDNAVKYNKPGGNVTVSLSKKPKGQTAIEIKDTGIGIPEHERLKIFDRFYRSSEDRNVKGFGLGLSIAKNLAHDLNIAIYLESTIGEGTKFTLIF